MAQLMQLLGKQPVPVNYLQKSPDFSVYFKLLSLSWHLFLQVSTAGGSPVDPGCVCLVAGVVQLAVPLGGCWGWEVPAVIRGWFQAKLVSTAKATAAAGAAKHFGSGLVMGNLC